MEIVQVLPDKHLLNGEIVLKMSRVCEGVVQFYMHILNSKRDGLVFQRVTVEYRNVGSRNYSSEFFCCSFSFIKSHSLKFLSGKWDNVLTFDSVVEVGGNVKSLKAKALKSAKLAFAKRMEELARELGDQAEEFLDQARNL